MPFRVNAKNCSGLPSFIGRIEKGGDVAKVLSEEIGEVILVSEDNHVFEKVIFVDLDDLLDGDVVRFNAKQQEFVVLYRHGSNSNSLFVTDLCNSKCLMCPQPPKERDSIVFDELLQQVRLLPERISELGITGGEPTLLGTKLIILLQELSKKSPECHCHILSNVRLLKNANFVRKIAEVNLKNLTFGVPLYAATSPEHDFIVQAPGAFDETVQAIYNLASVGYGIEIRVVLHRLTVPELKRLADFIYNKFPFVMHVAFMGMEEMGYVKKHREILYISPGEYQSQLFEAVRFLFVRGIPCSIYNLPLCLTAPGLRCFLRASISDFKVDYSEVCQLCARKLECPGLFHYQSKRTEVIPFIV